MITLEENMKASDYRQWLDEGYFFYKEKETEELKIATCDVWPSQHDYYDEDDAPVPTIDWDKFRFKLDYLSGEDSVFLTREEMHERVFPHWPQCGAINVPNQGLALVVQRHQQHQYKRTFTAYGVTIKIPRYWDIARHREWLNMSFLADDPIIVKELFFPEYPTAEDAISMLSNGWASVALSPHIILVGVNHGNSPGIYHRARYVGVLNVNNFVAIIKDKSAMRAARSVFKEVKLETL